MHTLELAKKAVERLAEVAITQEHFDSWDSAKQKQWLKDHPNSKFGKKPAGKAPKNKPIKQADLKKAATPTTPKEKYVTYKPKFTEVPSGIEAIIIDKPRTEEDRKKSAKILKEFEEDLNNQVKHMQENTGHGYTQSAVRSLADRSHKVIDVARKLEPIVDDFNVAMRGFIKVRDSKDPEKIQAAARGIDKVLWSTRQFRGPALTLVKKGRILKSVSPLAKGCTMRLEYMAKARDAALKEAKHAGLTDTQKDAAAKRSASMRARWGSMY